MKKRLLALLIAALTLSNAALADSRAAEIDGRLFLSLNGLLAVDGYGISYLDNREIRYLQADDNYIYYVVSEEAGEGFYSETLQRMDKSGRAEIIGNGRAHGTEVSFAENYSHLTGYSFQPGYGDMTVYDGYIYFIGANGVPGSYFTTVSDWDAYTGSYETRYETTSSVYRMDLDGSNLMEIIPDLGNGQAHMDIANGSIAVATCWRNAVYAYDFSDFRLYDLNGNLIREIENAGDDHHSWIYKDDCEFTCIVCAVHTDGERIFASLGDSEGDFASARFTDMDDPQITVLLEAFYVPSVLENKGIAFLTSDAEDAFWDESMITTLRLCWLDEGGSRILAHIPGDFSNYGMYLDKIGDMLYLSNSVDVIRVPVYGGEVEQLGENGFAPADVFDPENYVPGSYFLHDSNTRLYSAEELEVYDLETLGFMRNEILARHGYVFKKDKYKNHFNAQGWYAPDPGFSYSMLNDVEMANVETIKALEAKK